jgi:hypothetical protein
LGATQNGQNSTTTLQFEMTTSFRKSIGFFLINQTALDKIKKLLTLKKKTVMKL